MARGLGYVVALNSAWAAGEALGYLRLVGGPRAEPLAASGPPDATFTCLQNSSRSSGESSPV